MGNGFAGTSEPGAQLDPAGAHFQIGRDHFATANASGHENHVLFSQGGEEFLGQDGSSNRADMAAGFAAFDHQCIRAGTQQLLREGEGRGENQHFRAEFLDCFHAALGRNAASQHDMADLVLGADRNQVEQRGVHGDQVHAERLGGEGLGRGDFGVEQFGRHRPAGNHAKAAGIADRGDQVAFGYPAHRAAQDRVLGPQEGAAALHQRMSLVVHLEIPRWS